MPLTANALWIIAAMLLLGGLALGMIVLLGSIRLPMLARGEVKIRDIALSRAAWPDRAKQVSNAFDNQFQLPVLFYVAGLLSILFGATLLEVLLAWVFVILRFVHAFIHTRSNNVFQRFWMYTAGLIVLMIFWVDLVIRLLVAAAGTG
jgi:hypothetical protein